MGKEKFVINKVIDKNMIKDRVTEKHEMTFEKLEEVMVQDLGSISDLIGIQTENDINIYQFYEIWFSSLLTSTTLDELEFINANNLFGLDKNNLLDYKCQLMIDERIANFRGTLEDLMRSINEDNIGSYFQKFGDISNQAKQGIMINMILGLDREGVELTPLGSKLKTCIDNIRKLHIDVLKNNAIANSKLRK
ncbi:MAG: hypothetical protein SO067_03785 [Bacilli bacterium]|nr:hypothetical protein [Bacilli bacterium]